MTFSDVIGRLRELAENATPGPWRVAYWPTPEPHWWIGQVPENEFSSKLGPQITGPILNEADAAYIASLPPEVVLALCDVAVMLERAVAYAEEIERGIDFEGDAKMCARHVQIKGRAALARLSAAEEQDG